MEDLDKRTRRQYRCSAGSDAKAVSGMSFSFSIHIQIHIRIRICISMSNYPPKDLDWEDGLSWDWRRGGGERKNNNGVPISSRCPRIGRGTHTACCSRGAPKGRPHVSISHIAPVKFFLGHIAYNHSKARRQIVRDYSIWRWMLLGLSRRSPIGCGNKTRWLLDFYNIVDLQQTLKYPSYPISKVCPQN